MWPPRIVRIFAAIGSSGSPHAILIGLCQLTMGFVPVFLWVSMVCWMFIAYILLCRMWKREHDSIVTRILKMKPDATEEYIKWVMQ